MLFNATEQFRSALTLVNHLIMLFAQGRISGSDPARMWIAVHQLNGSGDQNRKLAQKNGNILL